MPKLIKYTWIPVVISSVIFYLCCLITSEEVPEIGFDFFIPTDKIVHFLMYFGLSGATAAYYIFDKKGKINILLMILGAIVIPILYGGMIEIIQDKYYPPRTGDWWDFVADALGSLATLPFIFYFRKFMLKQRVSFVNI